MIKLLIVEDTEPVRELIRMSLTDEGYHCVCARDGRTAADLIESQTFDLVLLDIMLPEIDGYELMEYIRHYEMPVIFLTARTGLEDRVRGLRLGAEDYITKPFEICELLARVEAVLRRYNKTVKEFRFEGVVLNAQSRIVTKDGRPVELTVKEFDLLHYLLQNRGKALYRAQIYAAVWGADELGESRTVDLHIQRLRKKLSLQRVLVPVYKVGYRLDV